MSQLEEFKRFLEKNSCSYSVRSATQGEGRHGASFILVPEKPANIDQHVTFEIYGFDVFGRYLGKIINDYFIPGKYAEIIAGLAS